MLDDLIKLRFVPSLQPHVWLLAQGHSAGPLVAVDNAYVRRGEVRSDFAKGVNGVIDGIGVGAELLVVVGHLGAPRVRRLDSMYLGLELLAGKRFTPKVLQILTGVWVAISLYRRPMPSTVQAMFDYAADDATSVYDIDERLGERIAAMVAGAPMSTTDVRAPYVPQLHTLDASERGGGSVVAAASI